LYDFSKSYTETFRQQGFSGKLALGVATAVTLNQLASATCKFAEIPSILFGYGKHGRIQQLVPPRTTSLSSNRWI
jgi:hypothetical protein